MAFGKKKDRPLYIANVRYYGEVDETAHEERDEIEALTRAFEAEDLGLRAWVEAPEAPELVPGRNALVPLIPMLAPTLLFMNASAATGALYPTVGLLEETSDALLESESEARSYSLEGAYVTVGGAPQFETYDTFNAMIPTAVPESEGRSKRVQEFALMQQPGEDGGIWARSRAPEKGGQAFFANSGLLLLIQQVAQTADYEETIVPIAAGLGAFAGQFEAYEAEANEDRDEDLSEENWAAMGEGILRLDWSIIHAVVFSDDPREALAQVSGD